MRHSRCTFFTKRAAILGCAAVAALACAAAGLARTGGDSGSAQTRVAIPGLSRLALGDSAAIGRSNLPRYAYVLLSMGESPYIRAIKAASPRTKVLAYQSASEAVDYCDASHMDICASPVSYQQAVAHDAAHPSDPWLLYSSGGQSLTMPSYPTNHLVNIGSASLRRQWASSAAARLLAKGFDGVYMDSVLGKISDTGTSPTIYASDAEWEQAMRGFVAYVGPRLKARGLYVLANSYKSGPNDGSSNIAWWASIAGDVSGLQAEYWLQAASSKQPFDTNPCCWTGHWASWLALADAAQKHGADFFAVDKGSSQDVELMTYLRASYLLVWNGRGGGFSYAHEPDERADPWNPAWATDIGKPTGIRYKVGVGWRRDYSHGTVVVNPDAAAIATVDLRRRYATIDGTVVSSVTLAPRTGVILSSLSKGA